ncbi:unnamed protein product, partial [Pylaiella littoralis]
RRLFQAQRTPARWKSLRTACKGVQEAIDAGINAHLERYVAKVERLYEERDMRGLYKHLKGSVGLDGRPSEGQQFIQDENGVLLRSQSEIAQRWKIFLSGL